MNRLMFNVFESRKKKSETAKNTCNGKKLQEKVPQRAGKVGYEVRLLKLLKASLKKCEGKKSKLINHPTDQKDQDKLYNKSQILII